MHRQGNRPHPALPRAASDVGRAQRGAWILGSGHAGRFPARRRRSALDRRARPADARPRSCAACTMPARRSSGRWSPGPDDSVFLGTGNNGRVVRVDRAGNGSVFFDSGEMEVHALAPAPNGGLYVGTSPDGRIYRVDAKGQATPFFDPDDKYIWALAVDPKGTVYAATGDKGVVYRITPDGKGAPFFTAKTTHAICAGVRRQGPAARRHGLARPRVPRRCARQGLPAARHAVSGSESAARRSEGHPLRRGAERQAVAGRRRDAGVFDAADTPPAAPVPNVSSEITSIAIIDVPVTPQPAASGGRERRSTRADGRRLSRAARRPLGRAVGVARRLAVRRRVRGRRLAARRDRRQGQDLPARRRSDAADAAHARQRAAGDDAPRARRRAR